MNKRNIGVVIKFNDITCNNYGFIDSFFNPEDIFFHRSFILFDEPKKGDLVSFEPVQSAKGLRGEKVLVLNEQTLAKETDFSDAEYYEKIRKGILRTKGSSFFESFLTIVPEENFRNYAWLRKNLDCREHVELCLKMFREQPNPEIEAELSDAIKNVGEIQFSLPIDLAVKENFWIHSDKTSKIAALKNFAANLSAEELFKIIDKPDEELSIAEIATVLHEVLGNEKFSELVETCVAQSKNFNDWAKFILENELPDEIILKHLKYLNCENNLKVLEKYFDTLTVEKINSLSESLPPKEIIRIIKDHKTFAEKISSLINDSTRENDWANYLIDDIELFKTINLRDDVIIFFVYAFVKCKKDLNVLADALLAKKEIIKSSLRLQVVCRYAWAAYKKSAGDISAAEKAKFKAEDALMGIFNEITERLEFVTENGSEFEFTEHKAHILPPCTGKIKDCHFCEAVTWPEKVKDKSGNMTWKLGRNYCPRLNCSDRDCFRIIPDLNLSSEKWSIVELTKALELISYETKQELEFFMRIGGEFNRIYDLQKNLKCCVCGKYMRSIKRMLVGKEYLI